MFKFNHLDLIVLSNIDATPRSTGYELTKIANGYSHQQVYRQCNKMRAAGLLTPVIVPQDGKPDRITYTLTNKAMIVTMVQDWLCTRKIYQRDGVIEINAVIAAAGFIGEIHAINWLTRFKNLQIEYHRAATERGDLINGTYYQYMIALSSLAVTRITDTYE